MNRAILRVFAATVHKWPSTEYPTWHYVYDFTREGKKWFIRKWNAIEHWTWVEIRKPKRIQFLTKLNIIAEMREPNNGEMERKSEARTEPLGRNVGDCPVRVPKSRLL